jgi:hypothetical protein
MVRAFTVHTVDRTAEWLNNDEYPVKGWDV